MDGVIFIPRIIRVSDAVRLHLLPEIIEHSTPGHGNGQALSRIFSTKLKGWKYPVEVYHVQERCV